MGTSNYFVKHIRGFHHNEKTETYQFGAIGTVVVGKSEEGIYARGISLCSLMDKPNKARGREIE